MKSSHTHTLPVQLVPQSQCSTLSNPFLSKFKGNRQLFWCFHNTKIWPQLLWHRMKPAKDIDTLLTDTQHRQSKCSRNNALNLSFGDPQRSGRNKGAQHTPQNRLFSPTLNFFTRSPPYYTPVCKGLTRLTHAWENGPPRWFSPQSYLMLSTLCLQGGLYSQAVEQQSC